MSTITLKPAIKAKLVLRFEDGTEQVLGDVRFSPDVNVTLTAPGQDVYFTGEEAVWAPPGL